MKPQGCGGLRDQSLMNTARGFPGIRIPLSVLQSGDDMFNKFLKRQKKTKRYYIFLFLFWVLRCKFD